MSVHCRRTLANAEHSLKRNPRFLLGMALVLCVVVSGSTLYAQQIRLLQDISDSISQVRPCVVLLIAQSAVAGQGGTGTGFFVSPDGYIATCNHVVEGAARLTARLWDGQSFDAQVIGTDAVHDVALVKVGVTNTPYLGLRQLRDVSEGMDLACSGYPSWGFVGAMTTTKGSVTAIAQRHDDTGIVAVDVIWTDAAINPGNSGGPVWLQETCEVIGLAMATLEQTEGMKLVTPVDYLITLASSYNVSVSTGQVLGGPERGEMVPPPPGSNVAREADLVLEAQRLNSEGKYAEALAKANAVLQLNAGNADAWFARGYASDGLHRWDDAIASWDKVIEIEPDNMFAWYNRGGAHSSNGDHQLAIADYTEAIRLNPNYGNAYHNRGWTHYYLREYEPAVADYTEALRCNPEQADSYNNRGLSYRGLGDDDRAIADYTEAIRINPNYALPYNNRGYVYYLRGEHNQAIPDFTRAIDLDPNYAAAYSNRGSAHYAQQDHDRALRDYSRAIELNPQDSFSYNGRGCAYHMLGQYDTAIADYDQAILIEPDYAWAYDNRGLAFSAKGDKARAERDWRMAVKLDPDGEAGKSAQRNLDGLQ